MSQQFVDREQELDFLKNRYATNTAECLILYGRRRVGKTELLLQFLKDKPGIYFLASEEGDWRNIREFAHHVGQFLGDENFERITFESWLSLFNAFIRHTTLAARTIKGKVVIVIDEFPYLIARNPAIPSVFQQVWDGALREMPVMLVLSGSSISTMETAVLGYSSPLYGRRSGQWQVEPLPYTSLREFLPWSREEIAQAWFVLGGIPAYLRQFQPDRSFWENVRMHMLNRGAYLYAEAEILMNYEFREPANYMVIFKALASGLTRLSDICMATGLDKSMVSKYLDVLCRLHIVRDEVPVTASASLRRRQYRIVDPYLMFWFRYIAPNRIDIEAGRSLAVEQRIQSTFPQYCGQMFERLTEECIRHRIILANRNFSAIGRWWYKESEIDCVCTNDSTHEVVFVECKWSHLKYKDALRVLLDLKTKAAEVLWHNKERTECYCLVGKIVEDKERLRKQGYLVYDLADLSPDGDDRSNVRNQYS
ncbi:MAG: ATP-binding protein [Methanoregula sp.]|nr:ATP-binding protein [Methanoregula sp.]